MELDFLYQPLLPPLFKNQFHKKYHVDKRLPPYHFQVQKVSTTVLSAMMAGMDDKEDLEDDITLEAMSGLTRILAEIKESDIMAILINIALRIQPCFEKVSASKLEGMIHC